MKRNYFRNRFTTKMQKKLAVLFLFVLLAFVGLSARLVIINRDNGEKYKKQVLSQQQYDSRVIPFKRGDIVDSKGTKLAVSEKVYNVILDAKLTSASEEVITATVDALGKCFSGLSTSEISKFIHENPTSQYHVLLKKLHYDEITDFVNLQNDPEEGKNIKGIWFEEEYVRTYPNGTMACDAIGFTGKDNVGTYGLEEYYNDVLNGINGREYGYLNGDNTLERTTKAAIDGNTIVTTLDANLQNIVEKYLYKFNEDNKNVAREGNGAYNVGAIMMDVHNGEILAMASYPNFDLNNVYDPEPLLGSVLLDKNGKVATSVSAIQKEEEKEQEEEGEEGEEAEEKKEESASEEKKAPIESETIITQEVIDAMDEDTLYANLNALWKNFAITATYEPGSVAKPFTTAAGLECGALTGNEVYFCGGSLWYGGHEIHCHNRLGDGQLTVKEAIEKSCNVALMQMGDAIGKTAFLKYWNEFNFGLRTNIDLAGEARTAGLVYNEETMGEAELATSTFGQGFNATMIQMITAFSALVNGGYYYEPHMVNKILSSDGTTVKNIEPRLLKQVISASTSEKIIDYCNGVVTEGTGKTARPAGYAIGGKTGTAEMVPRNKKNYVVSFMGYAPADNPQIAIYVVVDRPNAVYQDDAKFATRIVRNILTEALPYLNFFMTEELTEEEQEELANSNVAGLGGTTEVETTQIDPETGEPVVQQGEEGGEEGDNASGDDQENANEEEELSPEEQAWQEKLSAYETDPETGYLIEPGTGILIDPETGAAVEGASFMGDENQANGQSPEEKKASSEEQEKGEEQKQTQQ